VMRALLDVNVLIALRHGGQFVTFCNSISVDRVRRAAKKHIINL